MLISILKITQVPQSSPTAINIRERNTFHPLQVFQPQPGNVFNGNGHFVNQGYIYFFIGWWAHIAQGRKYPTKLHFWEASFVMPGPEQHS